MPGADLQTEPVPGRDCGPCQMCCKVFPIPETQKPPYGLCGRARPGGGCADYAGRPDVCREFFCLWRLDGSLSDAWRPDVAGFALHDPEPWGLLISCDVDQPDAWRRPPYGETIRAWVAEAQRRQIMVGARAGARLLLLLRDREIELDA